MNQAESSYPAGLGWEMNQDVDQVRDRRAGTGKILRARIVGPVDNERFPDNILARNEAPIAAVERLITVISHSEKVAVRHHNVAVFDVMIQHVLSADGNRRIGLIGEIVAVGIQILGLVDHVRFVQQVAVEVNVFVFQMKAIAGNSHNAFHKGLTYIDRVTEDNNVTSLRLTIRKEILRDGSRGGESKFIPPGGGRQ